MKATTSIYLEHQMSEVQKDQLKQVLHISFPGYFEDRLFHKQLPTFRFLLEVDERVIGHVGVIHRVVAIDGKPIEIFGVLDLCVHPDYRRAGLGTRLMKDVSTLANDSKVQHVILFADHDEQDFYTALGFQLIDAECRWLAIEESCSHSVIERSCKDILMIKSNKLEFFKNKKIDLLGELF